MLVSKKQLGVAAMSAIGLVGMSGVSLAAADPNLTSMYASTTAYFTDNIPGVIGFVVALFLGLAGVALAFGGIRFGYGKIKNLFKK